MKKGLLVGLSVVGVLAVGALILGGTVIGLKNQFVTADENIKSSWAQVENVLQRRSDLIPNLVNTVKGYAKQEKDIFTQIAEARAKLGGAQNIPDKINANNQLDSALSRLLVVVERYPDLKSNQNFMSLQDELAGTENRIAVERKRFNESVQAYNVLVRKFPGSLVAGFFGFTTKDMYFQAPEEAKKVPQVNFN
jgi:LemA protein